MAIPENSVDIIRQQLGTVTAYSYAVKGGYTGTEAEFEALLANVAVDLGEIENLAVYVTPLGEGATPTASYSNGVLTIGIPKGDTGDSGVYVGTTEPTNPNVRIWINPEGESSGNLITDVKINGTSIVNGGEVEIPVASSSNLGVVKPWASGGLQIYNNMLMTEKAESTDIKNCNNRFKPIVPANQHEATFYGFALASGDRTQAQSENEVGTYTDSAKDSIQQMLGIDGLIAPHDTVTATAAHAVNEIFIMGSKLYRATSAIAVGDTITVGTNCSAVKISDLLIKDVQINGTSIVSHGVAEIPIGGSELGVLRPRGLAYGITQANGSLYLVKAAANEIKGGDGGDYKPIVPSNQHQSTFYGLAKAAGDSTQSASDNAVGTYTDSAKSSIQSMLDVPSNSIIAPTEASTTATSAHAVGEVFFLGGKLYQATSAIAIGDTIADTGGSANCAEINIGDAMIKDVQVGGTSVLNDGVANVPIAGLSGQKGVISIANPFNMAGSALLLNIATSSKIKEGTDAVYPLIAKRQHESVFYGLSKASGTDLANETVTVGTYPDSSKDSIQRMLGIDALIATHDTATATVAHAIGDVFIMSGKLYRATSAIAVNDTITVGTNCEVVKIGDLLIKDVQVGGSSVVTDNVANVPVATASTLGVIKAWNTYGVDQSGGNLRIFGANASEVKDGTHSYHPIVPYREHEATFYGLSKVAGVDLANETVTLGTYPQSAKTAIKQMLGVNDSYDCFIETVSGTDPVIVGEPSYRYNCGEVYTLSITPPASGTIDVIFTSGTTPTVLTLPNTVRMPDWWVGVEANTTYEFCITDATYCGVISWAD